MTIHTSAAHLAVWREILERSYAAKLTKSKNLIPLEADLQTLLQNRLDDVLDTCRNVSLLGEAVTEHLTFATSYRHAWDNLLYTFAITEDDVISRNVAFVFQL